MPRFGIQRQKRWYRGGRYWNYSTPPVPKAKVGSSIFQYRFPWLQSSTFQGQENRCIPFRCQYRDGYSFSTLSPGILYMLLTISDAGWNKQRHSRNHFVTKSNSRTRLAIKSKKKKQTGNMFSRSCVFLNRARQIVTNGSGSRMRGTSHFYPSHPSGAFYTPASLSILKYKDAYMTRLNPPRALIHRHYWL